MSRARVWIHKGQGHVIFESIEPKRWKTIESSSYHKVNEALGCIKVVNARKLVAKPDELLKGKLGG